MEDELKSTWNGLKLANEAETEDDLDFDKVAGDINEEADDEDDEDDDDIEQDSDEFDVQLSPSDERLLEELLRLKLTSLPPDVATSSLLPVGGVGAAGLNLFQPRNKLEQFEDILLESQLLEAALPEVTGADANFESVGFDFEASDAIFKDDDDIEEEVAEVDATEASSQQNADDNEQCDCNTCKERMRHKDELLRLRQTWSEVREAVTQVYNLCMCSDESQREKPNCLPHLKEKLRQLLWRDPHQLYQRLEQIVKDFVVEQKVKLIKLLRSQAKNPCLAQDFIQKLLDGYERLCNACQHLSPVMIELENEHLSQFSLTWEVLNKYLHQSIIYSDPIIQNNVPIFISQLRSLYQDKENEGKYTELVRGFLDFDVEMSNIVSFWKNSEKMLEEYNKQQVELRAKQKMLKEDWERFKAQRRDLKIQMDKDHNVNKESTCSSSSLIEGIKKCQAESTSKLAETFPSILTAEGKKSPPRKDSCCSHNKADQKTTIHTTDIIEDLSKTLEDSKIQDSKTKITAKDQIQQPPPLSSTKPKGLQLDSVQQQSQNQQGADQAAGGPQKKSTTAKELRDLMYQHYCVGKGKLKKPSANAIKKGKVPPPTCSTVGHHQHAQAVVDPAEASTDEDLTEDEDDSDNTYSSSEASKATTTTASESHNKNSAHCNCCYCEVFGPGGQSVAPVSRNYPEMRERLRLLLSKKKRKNNNTNNQQSQGPPPPPPPKHRSCSASSSTSSNLRSSRSVDSKKSGTPDNQNNTNIDNVNKQHASATASSTTITQNEQPAVKDDKPLDELLDFIEGNRKSMNDKKRAKKERQKQQKIDEIRKKEFEEQKRKKAEEAERKRREEESKKKAEMERQLEKKRKKKEAQRIKKLAAKGLLPEHEDDDEAAQDGGGASGEAALEELRAKHFRELQELQLMHQRQLEEETKKLKFPNQQHVGNNLGGNNQKFQQQNFVKLEGKNVSSDSSRSAASLEMQPVKRNEALQSKPGTQIKITRTPSGGVEFTTVPSTSGVPQQNFQQHQSVPAAFNTSNLPAPPPPARPQQTSALHQPQQAQDEQTPRPSIPSKTGAPMVTIRRIETPNAEPMVTISMAAKNNAGNNSSASATNNQQNKNSKTEDKLLYTLVNGQAMRTPEAPSDLLPNAKLLDNTLSKKQKKKLKKQTAAGKLQPSDSGNCVPEMVHIQQQHPGYPPVSGPSFLPQGGHQGYAPPTGPVKQQQQQPQQQRPPLPLDPHGKVDLERLQLPPGISITRMAGPTPDRKYFPASTSEYGSNRDQSVLPLPGTLQPAPASSQHGQPGAMQNPAGGLMDYSAIEGLPPGLNGPNVIVVDTSSLKTREEEEKEEKEKDKKTKKNKKKTKNNKTEQQQPSESIAKSATISTMPTYLMPSTTTTTNQQPQQPNMGNSNSPVSVDSASTASNNSLKSGPQVLIKNINGKVTITPVPGTGATPVNTDEMLKKNNSTTKKSNNSSNNNHHHQHTSAGNSNSAQQVNGKKSPPTQHQVVRNHQMTNSSSSVMDPSLIQKSHSVPNVNGHVQKNRNSNTTTHGSNHDNTNNYHNLLNENKHKYSFNTADGDDPDKVFAPSNDIDMDLADDSDRVVEQYKRFLAEFPSPTDQPRVRPKVELDMKNIFKKKTTFSNSNSNLTNSGESVSVTSMTTQ